MICNEDFNFNFAAGLGTHPKSDSDTIRDEWECFLRYASDKVSDDLPSFLTKLFPMILSKSYQTILYKYIHKLTKLDSILICPKCH